MSSSSGAVVAAEALLVSVAQRFLVGRFQKVQTTRGEGTVVFSFDPSAVADPKSLADCVERLMVNIVKEVTGRTKLPVGTSANGSSSTSTSPSAPVNFPDIGSRGTTAITFDQFMKDCGETLTDIAELPPHPSLTAMVEVLYNEAASEYEGPATIKDFPSHLCPEGARYDFILKNQVIVRGYSSTAVALIPQEENHLNGSGMGGGDLMAMSNMNHSMDMSLNTAGSVVFSGGASVGKILIEAKGLATVLAQFSSAPVEENLPVQWRQRMFSLEESNEVLRTVYHSLIQYWQGNTHTEKLRVNATSLLQIVSGDVRGFVEEQVQLASSDLKAPWRIDMAIMERCLKLCTTWKQHLKSITTKDWHGWDGGQFKDLSFDAFVERLQSAVRVRELYETASQLLHNSDVLYDCRPDVVFDGLSLLDTKRTPRTVWVKACDEFERAFSLVESSLAGQMKGMLGNITDPEAKARVMMQYTALLKRESVRDLVSQDLSSTFDSLLHRLKAAQSRFNQQKTSVSPSDARGMLLQTRMCIAEVGSCLDTSRSIFHRQSTEFTQVEDLGKTVEKEVVDAEKAVVTAWIASLEGRCDKLAGLEAAVTMTISGDRESMRCKMSPVLRDLLEDVRAVQCSLSGPKAPIKVSFSTATQRALDDAEKLSKQATRTSRIMAAYNSVIEQILPTTKLMLDDIKGKAITILFPDASAAPSPDDSPSSRNIGFTGASDLEGINARFQSAAEAFSTENRIMRRHHSFFTQAVVDLYNIDLLRSPDQWKASLKEMRDGFEGVEKNHTGSTTKTMYPWRRHWDVQIYKALEHQYQRGLENLNEEVQEFHVDLIFKQGQVQFKPGFESLREAYYTKIREFVGIPQRFKGVGNSEFFATMPSRNAEAITLVHQKAMELFTKVSKVRRQFRDYVVVGVCGTNGAPDLDFLVENLAQEKKQWEEGYALVKDRRRKVSYMEDLVKVDCINISTTPIKASIIDHLQKLEDALTASLRNTMQKRLARIDDFVLFASNIIERQPSTLDEVGKANQAYNKFKELVPEYQQQLNEIDEMNARVRIHAGASLEMGVTRSRWEHLMDAMNSHHKQIDQSVSKMRVSVDALIAKFLKDLTRFSTNWNKHKPISLDSFKNRQEFIEKGLNYVKNQVLELGDYVTNGKELREKCAYFRIPEPDFSLLDETQNDIETHEKMWKLYEEFETELEKLRIEDWLTFRSRIYVFEDFLKEWAEKVDALVQERGGQDNIVTSNIKKLMRDWSQAVPVLKFVRGDGYLSEHWAEMFRLLDMDKGMSSDKLTFGDIIGKHALLIEKEKDLKYLNGRAQGEVQIRDAMQDLRTWAMEATFTLITPQEGSTVKVQLITEWKDAMTQVSDNQALIGSLKDSPYFVRFADEAAGWEQKLVAVAEYMVLLNSIQRKWCYLEPLFARGALPHEKPRFTRVDKEFVTILRDVESDPRIMTLAQQDLTDKLKNILDQIDRCQKALNEFLEQKRDKFPRFYFISDEDLLEILGQSKNPTVIQTHLKKLFAGINSVQFDDSKTAILAMVSADNEVVPLSRKVSITDNNVEDWLIRLDECMRFTLRELLKGCVDAKDATQLNTIEKYPSQILQVAEQIFFAQEVESAIQKKNLKAVLSRWQTKLHDLTGYSLHGKPVTELKVKALILDIIHCIEVVELLEEKRVESTASWWWQKQLRYYPGAQDPAKGGIECLTRMVDTEFNYTFEYQGNAAKLVHTPLTDKCYLVLTNGMHLGYGGNPYGPAGTGKTESVKALGSAMGRQVLVFNCDEGIDFKAMGRIFVGIVKCGAWGCFDEFNRLKVDQLSAISQMIQAIQESLKNNEPSCSLLGRTIDVNPNSGIFVTLNPAGKGYGGRSKLPDNLKQLFRAVAMSVPDNELITATMLQSEGFLHARALSKKVVDVYRLSKQLMSAQQHYDWGLRPLKAVLRLGGSLVQQHRHANPDSKTTEDQEAEFMVQSLRINTISKLTFDDGRLFNGLIADIFPKIAVKEISYKELEVAVEAAFKALHLSHIDGQVYKVLQLYEAMNQRMGVVLVGPSGSGKSTLLKVLRKALQIMNVQVPMHVVNPKALPRQQLLGYMDPDTREWFDGVLSAAARNVVKEAAEVRSWIFCDGDIDPEWVESLNSVLDDNKLLTMPNGVRIQFGSNVNFVFETHSLEFASPATVSRMGIIFLSEQDLHPKYAVASFMDKVPEATRETLSNLVDSYLYKAIEILTAMENFGVESTRMGLLTIALNHVASAESKLDFACGLIRGLGSTLAPESQSEYALKIFQLCGEEPNDTNKPLNTYYNRKKKASASFNNRNIAPVEWTSLQHGGDMPMVRTVEIERISAVLEPLVKDPSCKPFFLVGPEGCGKSMILQNCFQEEKGVRVAVIHCSAQTSAQHVTQKLNQLCGVFSTNSGKVLRPKEGDRLVIALKDINLPKPDKYGTVQLHSLLQQLLLYQGFYDSELEWVGIEKIQIVASMNPVVSAGRFPVASRLLAIVNLVNIPYPSKESLNQVYTAFFAGLLKHPQLVSGPQYENGQQLAHCLTNVFEKVKKKFEGEEYAHCIFSPRDITAITCGVLNYSLEGTSLAAIVGYETSRVFADRLASPEDRNRAEKIFTEQLASVGYNGAGGSKDEKEKPIYVSWGSDWPLDPKTPKQLKLLPYADVEKEIKSSLVKYGREFREISMTPVVEVFSWIPRLDRILSSPGGHALLVGRCGVGRRAAATIAAFMLRMAVVSVNMTKDYSVKSFRSDLRSVIQRVAVQNEKVMLLLEDHNFTSETFLEMVNSLVSSGEVAGLYTPEELEQMLAPLREEASNEGFIGNLNNFFLQRIHLNLRVVTIMDPTNILFAPRCQANPGLLTSCAVVWMGTWTSDTTKSICKYVLRKVIKEIEGDSNYKGFHLHREMLSIHESLGQKATPYQFQTFMTSYDTIYQQNGKASSDALQRLEAGLSKLKEAERDVDKIKTDVGKKKIEMQKKQEDADNALTQIQQNIEDSAEQRTQAEELQVKLEAEAKDIVVKKGKAEEELSGIQPILDAAKEAVGGIKSESLNEIRSLRNPPEAVRDVLEGVLALLGVADNSWNGMKKFLGERGVKDQILAFDAKSINSKTRDNVSKLVQQKAQSFKHENIVRASVAAAPMATWVTANVEYSAVLERIGPLTRQLEELEENKTKGEEKLGKLKSKLEKIDKNVEKLRKDFSKMIKEADELKDSLEKAEKQLNTAEELLEKLTGEKDRWSRDASAIREKNKQMPRQALLSAAFLTYLAKNSEEVRAEYLKSWSEKLGNTTATPAEIASTVTSFMCSESQLLQYKSEGLPADNLSQENAVAILTGQQTPLIVDPANQAIQWMKNHFQANDVTVEVTSIGDERFTHTLELAIRFGKTLLVTEIDTVDSMLVPVLRRDLISQGPKKVVQLGNKTVDWQDTFRIFLFSRSSDMNLTPDTAPLVTEVNFSVTRSGLESQLLGITIQKENPELETQKVELLEQEDALHLQLSKLESSLLADLANSHGDLLQNTQLIESLNQLKTQAQAIGESLVRSKELQVELDKKREVYRPYAHQGSVVFFLTSDLVHVNRMYQFSLADFLHVFRSTLESYQAAGGEDIDHKIVKLSIAMAQRAFLDTSRGLFKIDRVQFAMHFCHLFFPEEFPAAEWSALIGSVVGDEEKAKQSLPSWGTATANVVQLSYVMALENASEVLGRWQLNDESFWGPWVKDREPERLLSKRSGLSRIDALLIVSCFRRDRLEALMTHNALELLKIPALAEVATVEAVIAETKCDEPLLLITSSGADPSMDVQEVAYKSVGRDNFVQIALGGGQTDEAMQQLRRCALSGDWLFLKNLHLVLDWVSVLEKEIASMQTPHENFRLFLTTEAHDAFPIVLLKSCAKMTIEAPPGIRQNLLRTYSTWTEDFLSKLSVPQSQMLFGLAWFHAVVQERRRFIPQGWVKFYEFSQADLKSACDILLAKSTGKSMDWVAIQGLFESAIYGGRLDNDQDTRVLSVFLRSVFNDGALAQRDIKLLGSTMTTPNSCDHASIIQHIFEKVADTDAPTTFSLPENADRAVQETSGGRYLTNLRALASVGALSSAGSQEALKGLLEPVMAVWNAAALNLASITPPPSIPATDPNPSPLQVFFVSEVSLLSRLGRRIISIYADLKRVADGNLIPSDELRDAATTLANGVVPDKWLDWMVGPESSALWLQLLQKRIDAMAAAFEGFTRSESSYLQQKVRLIEFLRPHTFLNALRQYTARKTNEPMVKLVLGAYPAGSGPKGSVHIILDGQSLALQGATCNGSKLSPLDNNAPTTSPFPDVTISWLMADAVKTSGFVQLPVYQAQDRELHMFEVQVPCGSSEERDHWTLSGSAIYLS